MITTFFGEHSFGGDAVYVERLAAALLRQGHEVEVIHCVDAYEGVRGRHAGRPYTPPPGLHVHGLKSRAGLLSPLWTHQTGRLGPKARPLSELLHGQRFDVIHLHNVSLIGGTQLLEWIGQQRHAVKLMTAHEHWLICPLSLLWKYNEYPCDEPTCLRCTFAAGRPPQLWRYTKALPHALAHLDALLFPSRHTLAMHQQRGIDTSGATVLPYFLPADWAGTPSPALSTPAPHARPFFAMAGRLVKEKGYQDVIPLMAHLPDIDLRIAGSGPYEKVLCGLAKDLPNVEFLGWLDFPDLAMFFQEARAVVVPSLFYETFGYVILEAFSTGTPVVARDRGALPEWIEASGGGLLFETQAELLDALSHLAEDPQAAHARGARGAAAWHARWTEEHHLTQYLALIEALRGAPRPAPAETG